MQKETTNTTVRSNRALKRHKGIEVNFTIFQSTSPLNKTITEDGKKYSNAYFSNGVFKTTKISSLSELKKSILKLSKYEAIGLGVHKDKDEGEIAPKSIAKELSRSKENFKWNNDYNLIMLDYDYFEGITKVNTANDYKTLLEEIEPKLKDVEMLITKSTSSLVIDNKTKKELNENGGFHCYFIVKGSIEHFKSLLWHNCWAKGHGAVKFAADGSILSRTIFDASVLSPERLVFEALPTIKGDLSLLPRDVKIFNIGNGFLDVEEMEDNIEIGHRLEIEAKNNAKLKSSHLKELYIQKEAKELSIKSQISYEIAKKIIEAKTNDSGIIYEDDLIYFPNGEFINAGALTLEHDGMYILDPIEPDKANAVLNVFYSGRKTVYSFLHGGKTFEIIPADLDTKLDIGSEAKSLAKSFLENVWNKMFKYGYSEKMYENWEIMFQAYINASKPDFNTMYVISASAGAAKTTSLAHYTCQKNIETKGNFTVLIVVNTIQNGIDFKKFLTKLLDIEDKSKKYPRPMILFSKDVEKVTDEDGNIEEYRSDVSSRDCDTANILIVTHARLRKAVVNGQAEHLMSYKKKDTLFSVNRDLIAVDEAIDFEEKATINQNQTYIVKGLLQSFKTYYKNGEMFEKLNKIISVLDKFLNFCESYSQKNKTILTHNSSDVFGTDEDVKICYDTEFIELINERNQGTNLKLESYLTDLSILAKSNFFHIDLGGDGIVISSNIDRIPSNRGFVVLDASANINHEYTHYINKQKAQRVRVHLDAKRYDEVTIHISEESSGVGKINVPSNMLKNAKNKNIDLPKDITDDNISTKEEIESFKIKLEQDILANTTEKDKILIISNKLFEEYLSNELAIKRDFVCHHWGDLTGRNDLRERNVVYCLTQPFKPLILYLGKSYKYNKLYDKIETARFRISMLVDEVYQALLRANLRTNDRITNNAPKCDIYIRTSIARSLVNDSSKLIEALEKMLIGVKIAKWDFNFKGEKKYSKKPEYAYLMRDILKEWCERNPHDIYIEYSTLQKMRSDVFDDSAKKIRRYKTQLIGDDVSVMDWIEKQSGMKYLSGTESKKFLEEQKGIKIQGRGFKCFCKI